MKKNKILKTLQTKEDKIITVIEELKDFIYNLEDEQLSYTMEELYDTLLENLLENDNISLNAFRELIDENYE